MNEQGPPTTDELRRVASDLSAIAKELYARASASVELARALEDNTKNTPWRQDGTALAAQAGKLQGEAGRLMGEAETMHNNLIEQQKRESRS